MCRPKGLIFPDMVKKGTRGFHFPRGLHTHRYSCVALRALMKSQPSKPSQPSKLSNPSKPSQPYKPYFPRRLRHLLHHCVAEARI